MRKIVYCLAALLVVAATSAMATPAVNSVVFNLNVWEDCLFHTVTTDNSYPTSVMIDDEWVQSPCGWANLHVWRFSENGTDAAIFMNGDAFRFAATLVLTGTGYCESGLQVRPWWSESDGRLNVRTTDGEIACFGGRLPFYSFTGNHSISYVAGDPIGLEIIYYPNSLTELDPATITYNVSYGGMDYSSGPLPFDEGNAAEGYGTWGMLDNAQVGAHLQALIGLTDDVGNVHAVWSDIEFEALPPTGTEDSSWGEVKSLFR